MPKYKNEYYFLKRKKTNKNNKINFVLINLNKFNIFCLGPSI